MSSLHNRSLLSISWPVMMTMAVGISGPILDSWFLSRISDKAAAAVGATIPVFMLMQTILNSLGQAGAGIAGQYLGGRQRRLAQATFALLFFVVLCGGFLLGGLLCLFSPQIVAALGLEGEIAMHATLFLRIIGAGSAGRALNSVLSNVLAAQGLTRWNLWGSIGIVGGNTILNILLVSGIGGLPSFGVAGVAIATISSWAVAGLVTLYFLVKRLGFNPSWASLALGWKHALAHLLRIGLPSMVEPISFMAFQVVLASQIARLGTLPLTSRVYAANFANLPVLFSFGLGFGAQILVAHCVGAREFDTADRRLRSALAWGMGLSLVTALTIAVFGRHLIGFFTRDAAIIALGATLLWIDAVLQPAKAANIAITFSLRSSGDSRFSAIVGSGLMWSAGLAATLGLAFGFELGVIGIWAGMAIDEWIRAVVNWQRWKSGAWRSKGVMNQDKDAERERIRTETSPVEVVEA